MLDKTVFPDGAWGVHSLKRRGFTPIDNLPYEGVDREIEGCLQLRF